MTDLLARIDESFMIALALVTSAASSEPYGA